jgi:exosortase
MHACGLVHLLAGVRGIACDQQKAASDSLAMSRTAQLEVVADEQVSANPYLWWQVSVVGLLTLWLYWSVLVRLAVQWSRDGNFSHGFLVPAFSAYVLWQNREHLRKLTSKPCSGGLWIMLGALCVLVVGILGSELFLSRVSFVLLLVSVIVLFWGWDHMRAVRFPVLFLLLMIPLPAIVFNQLTFPLQILASKLAAAALPLLGVPVLREGNMIKLAAMSLEVADACSGIRSLFSLITLAVIGGYTIRERRRLWALLILAAIPIAVFANVLRIIGEGLLVQYWNANKAEGYFHTFSGEIVFLISLGIWIWLRQILLAQRFSSGARS